jgi:hypothetical protein
VTYHPNCHSTNLQALVVRVVLVKEIEWFRLDAGRAADPLRGGEVLGRVGAHLLGEDVLERLGPGDTVIELREVPEQLQEVQERGVCVLGVGGVGGALVMDERVRGDPGGDQEGGNAKIEGQRVGSGILNFLLTEHPDE